MNKLKQPKHKGLKIYCNRCKADNPKCNHIESHQYRIRVHINGTKNGVKVKVFDTRDVDEAIKQAIDFRKEMIANNFQKPQYIEDGNDFSLLDALVRYNQYLGGNHPLKYMEKNVSRDHQNEVMHYCNMFGELVEKRVGDIRRIKASNVLPIDISTFYAEMKDRYQPKTFNKCIQALKGFYKYLIIGERIKMENPFAFCGSRKVIKKNPQSISKEEFFKILDAVDNGTPYKSTPNQKRKKEYMYKPYLKAGFKMFLLIGGRREEIVELRWSDIFVTIDGTKCFRIHNYKVEREQETDDIFKYPPITADLMELLKELGYDNKRNTSDYILCPARTQNTEGMMDTLSAAFTHYKNVAQINKNISLKNLRKTYITWTNRVMGKDTGLLTSHSNETVLKDHYIDPRVTSAIDKGAKDIKIFGT